MIRTRRLLHLSQNVWVRLMTTFEWESWGTDKNIELKGLLKTAYNSCLRKRLTLVKPHYFFTIIFFFSKYRKSSSNKYYVLYVFFYISLFYILHTNVNFEFAFMKYLISAIVPPMSTVWCRPFNTYFLSPLSDNNFV